MSFVMLSDSQVVQARNSRHEAPQKTTRDGRRHHSESVTFDGEHLVADKIETTSRLYEILSARSDIDHPICVECTELLVEGLQKRLASATKERDAYVEFLRQANADIPSEEEVQQAKGELAKIREREAKAITELEKLEAEKAALDDEIAALDVEAEVLDREEEAFWAERNAFTVTLSRFQDERNRINTQYEHDTKQLQRLQRTNVYNDTFNIGYDGDFGTINGLRLGKLSNKNVEWTEINAAWGQTCLLLATVADKLGFSFQGYRLNPMGSTSIVERIEYPSSASANDPSHPTKPKVTSLSLYSSGDYPLGLGGLLSRSFDNAMVAFLECVRQLGEFVERTSSHDGNGVPISGLKMPYAIRKDRLHTIASTNSGSEDSVSIKFGAFAQEEWSKACKWLLTCCKFLLAHASNVAGSSRKRADA